VGEIMTGEIREPEVIEPKPNLGNTKDENSIININSDDQPNNISRDQLQDLFNNVMQAISQNLLSKLRPYRRNLKRNRSVEGRVCKIDICCREFTI